MKNIIITGAGGMIGPMLAKRLLNDGFHVVLTDLVQPQVPEGVAHPENATCLKGDICDPAFVQKLIQAAQPLDAIFIFHGIMSAGSEANFDLSFKVNVRSVQDLVLALRQSAPRVRVVYSSSQAVFGQPLPKRITDATMPTPEGTYGAHKLSSEIFINDMHRKGFIDAFIVRFPTVIVRPGAPSNAAPSFLSGMIREPMHGEECVIPLTDRSYRTYVCSPSSTIENLVRVLGLKSDMLPPHQRAIVFPGVSATIQEMMDALAKYGGEDKLKLLREETNPVFERILRSWPEDFDPATPDRLGLIRDQKVEDLVKEYIENYC
ncbi:putative nucleoside-diphosphate-sugar epimerase [Aureobasidium sp. EXF-12298]|nr:putative nucleoside-diphosphate-sugar epimerase [Aureobasidium sp. EXF-12298]KAI4763779.1 putative nucleoside-diphosphate-sugar epimerase [Aureobasidium sp. EXF-12344]KAI4782563.1 putative nucleoside-diphosphate-sugar epimerase [Aureobasidium sp. EXF-3400]